MNFLKEKRLEKGYSQTELSKLIGCERPLITMYERDNKMEYGFKYVIKLCDALDITLEDYRKEFERLENEKKQR